MDPAVTAALISAPVTVVAAGAAFAAGRAQARGAHRGPVDAVRRQHQHDAYATFIAAVHAHLGRSYWNRCHREAREELDARGTCTLSGCWAAYPAAGFGYDSLRAVVERVLGLSRARVENDRWTAFRSHWGVDAFYRRPGIEGALEKGGVEDQIGYYRRNHFIPVPEVASLTELNAMVDQWDVDDEGRSLRSKTRTIGEHFAQEQPLLRPLPREVFETGGWFTPRVSRFGRVTVRCNSYSVPVRFIGRHAR